MDHNHAGSPSKTSEGIENESHVFKHLLGRGPDAGWSRNTTLRRCVYVLPWKENQWLKDEISFWVFCFFSEAMMLVSGNVTFR